MRDPIIIDVRPINDKTVTTSLYLLIVAIVSVTITLLLNPTPRVARGEIFNNAAAWCKLRISELPPGDGNRTVFEQSLRDIKNRNVRWSIDDPSGIHYTLMVDFAKAWQDRSKRGVESVSHETNVAEDASKGDNRLQIPLSVFAHTIVQDGDEIVITYGNFNRRPLQMVLDQKSSRVIVRVDITQDNEHRVGATHDQVLQFLKNEVERLVASDSPIQLGTSGVTLTFNGKFPIWGPHTTCRGMQKEYDCLLFAEHASLKDGNIVAWGDDTKTPYYPYVLAGK